MAILKSEFSLGNGRLREFDALTVTTNSAGVALSVDTSVLLAIGATGFSLSGNTFLSPALATASAYSGDNDKVASQGYVEEQLAGVASPTKVTFAVPALSAFTIGNLVAMTSAGVALSQKNDEKASNVFGVVVAPKAASGSGTLTVQVDGEVTVASANDLSAFAKGDLVWGGANGGVTTYAALSANDYAVQVGIVSDVAADKLILQPRIFGQVA
jgi:hypothetical protein